MKTKIILLVSCCVCLNALTVNAQDKKERKLFNQGTVLISPNGIFDDIAYDISKTAYDPLIIGVATGNHQPKKMNDFVCTEGVIEIKYNSENGIIKNGDLLTTSSEPGVAMKAIKSGMMIGIALEDATSSSGLIKTRILLQYVK